MVVISASLMRLSRQSMTLLRIVLRPPRLATTSGFFRAADAVNAFHRLRLGQGSLDRRNSTIQATAASLGVPMLPCTRSRDEVWR